MKKSMRKKLVLLLVVVTVLSWCFPTYAVDVEAAASGNTVGVSYRTHVQTYGWQEYVSNGEVSGTTGQSKRLEGINVKLEDQDCTGDIEYRVHCQTYGWMDWVKNDEMAGTTGQSKRLEAIQIRLTGEMAAKYDIYYRVHSQTYGWLGWAKNGEYSGTAGYSKRLEGIQIQLVAKGGTAPGNTADSYKHPMVQYKTHVQTYGWQNWVQDGAVSGTTGQAKRLEGINIQLCNQEYSGDIEYKTHVQTYGWQDWVKNGAMSGTSGQAKRLEAIQIRLTGEMAAQYDIYYRVHAQTFGWMGWAKNGESAGTAGYAKRLEGIQIQLVPKGSAAPGSTANAYAEKPAEPTTPTTPTEPTTPSEPETPIDHVHTWVEETTTTHYEAWDEDIYDYRVVCGCGEIFLEAEEWGEHHKNSDCRYGYSVQYILVDTIHHDAYDEEVPTGRYICSECGAVK